MSHSHASCYESLPRLLSSRLRYTPDRAGMLHQPAREYSPRMDPERARLLLARERERIEQAISDLEEEGLDEFAEQVEPGDEQSESLYEQELEVGMAEDLAAQLAALERAEARLAAGTYGLSVESGLPIPDERLEALPLAERTVEEQERRARR
jgi:RNA polymerase-binding transcription factor